MRWSASALKHFCAFPNVIKKTQPLTPRSKLAIAKGNLFHELIQQVAVTGEVPIGVDDEMREWLTWAKDNGGVCTSWASNLEVPLGLSIAGEYVEVHEPEPHTYVPVSASAPRLLTAGRADVLATMKWMGKTVAFVADWKTGKYDTDPPERNLQLTALAFAAADKLKCDGFTRRLIYVQQKKILEGREPVWLDSSQAADAWGMLEAAAKLDDRPRPGPWCKTDCWESRMKRCEWRMR